MQTSWYNFFFYVTWSFTKLLFFNSVGLKMDFIGTGLEPTIFWLLEKFYEMTWQILKWKTASFASSYI